MAFGTITSTENTFGSVDGTTTGVVPGTLSGSVGVPGPAGPGVPAGGTAGQYLQKIDSTDYNTDWVTLNLAAYATESWVTAGFYPLASNPAGYLTSASLSGYALLSGATFTGTVSAPTPSPGTDSTVVATTEWVKDLEYAPLNSPQFVGNPRGPTPNLSDDDTSLATTAFVKGQGYLTSAALSGYAQLSGATFSGKVNFTPVSGVAGLNVGIGGTSAASTTAGDLWISTGGATLNFRDGNNSWRILAATSNTNAFSAPQIIDTTASTAALRVTQKGTGNAIEVEDSTTPDSTRFVVDQHGKVGVGVAPDATAALKVDTNGIMFGDGTVQTTAATGGGSYSSSQAIADLITGSILYAVDEGMGTLYCDTRDESLGSRFPSFLSGINWSIVSINGEPAFFDGSGVITAAYYGTSGTPWYISYNGVQASVPFGNFGSP